MHASLAATFLDWLAAWGRILHFAGYALAAALSPSTYVEATRRVAVRQIYFTAWQILLPFTVFMTLFSLVVIEITLAAARSFDLTRYAVEMILRVLVLELIPLLTALFVALRSGSAIATEVALMRYSGELEAVEAAGTDLLRHELVPRVVAAALSVISLTVLNCALALGLAYVAMYDFSPWGFAEFTRVVGKVFDAPILAGFALRAALFGAAVAVIPIAAGLDATRQVKSAPVAVMGGMVHLFFALGLLEVIALAAKYI
ncbi:MAG: ABC transporter permease [Betaproteobacteria bacterium]|nr:ABC transporter permease [Betaproteobacteria bacterium]